MTASPLLELRAISVAYGALKAIDGVSLSLQAGDVLGVCGDNGAGKSSLMKVIAGAHAPTGGTVSIDGEPVQLRGPRDALGRGIAAIYQDLALAPRLSIAENVFMGAELTRATPGLGWLSPSCSPAASPSSAGCRRACWRWAAGRSPACRSWRCG